MKFRNWGRTGIAASLLVTFLAAGIWHGASWNYVVFGLLHGIYLATSIYYKPYQKKLYKWLRIGKSYWLKGWQIFITFNLVCFAIIFFRGENIGDSIYIVQNLLKNWGALSYFDRLFNVAASAEEFVATILLSVMIIAFEPAIIKFNENHIWLKTAKIRWAYYYLMIFGIVIFGISAPSQFIYFKF
jgi:D-alanyl-lipoteichoic acid acyltransferase DltB (MBOAT superfamily)